MTDATNTPEPPNTPPDSSRSGGTAASAGAPPRRGRGRPARTEAPEGPGARERILYAAREQFAERGYDKATMRGIARAAGVDAALVHHYFGTKDDVFAAAVETSFEPAAALAAIFGDTPPGGPAAGAAPDLDGIGERLARFYLGVWENPGSRAPLLAIVRSALTNEAAAAVFRDFVLNRLLARVAERLAVPDPRLRAELAAAQMIGVTILRYVLRTEPLASADPEEVVRLVAPALQHHLTGEGPAGP
ncbi:MULTISPECIES: TetR/AcrR family transcriptional regulator [Streptomyces]|uniref:TetR/AcrR family transcriptional regulator n=1 Tax=Streptomyces tsukubensis (strain DSM 42081 / NBRC 108919 / NRRL 18488 / 9993) TaxID=1114943 RepID=I2N3S1_STRT9|nr:MULTISPECIES: TetR family transcriptional regulator [Streptomyces]AZK95747.1 TetR family transcriptional regulator [Streptomyces tsukubensis]EIF91668.1 regulatory protein TetR [Streptomyces tsukubensis NRRL18488]MYS67902.1 TetR family transcriptional regulator [Streptomyces sp. SID5473]QKM68226.1 TetR/AcrR family transcriptional regulator [Streptomyces tsukubensis NRRL18488]TAI43044.1 TetR/AcrR family transcriptional regulator [Streptomyces tsukubensis]